MSAGTQKVIAQTRLEGGGGGLGLTQPATAKQDTVRISLEETSSFSCDEGSCAFSLGTMVRAMEENSDPMSPAEG